MEWSFLLLILTSQCSFLTCQIYEYHYIEKRQNWTEAQKYCRSKHTDLATVYDLTDTKRLCNVKSQYDESWIGLYSKNNPNKTWHWSQPGVEFNESKTKWSDSEPDNKNEPGNYAIWGKSGWTTGNDNDKEYYVCSDENIPSSFTSKTKKTWIEAQKYCRNNHTDLISDVDYLEKTTCNEFFFIGLFRDSWVWSDESGYSFRNWEKLPGSEECAATTSSGTWTVDDCGHDKTFFCYNANVILIEQNKTWDEALYYCREHYHDMAYITDKDEQRWVGQKARAANSPYVWLGLHYTCTLQFWFWVTDKAVSYENWASDKTKDNCDMSGVMERGGKNKWYKKTIENKYNFICSKK